MRHGKLKPFEDDPRYYYDENGRFYELREIYEPGHPNYAKIFAPAPYYVGNINAYLFRGPNIFITATGKPICPNVPVIRRGADPVDGGNLILTDNEKNELLRTDPHAEILLRPYMMGRDFINRIPRWCLWLKDKEPADIRKCPRVLERIEKVREFRLNSTKAATRKKADTSMLFADPRECTTNYMAIPVVSSSKRRYIPIDWLTPDVIAGNKLFVCENSTLYQFGILNSVVHMAWVRKISGKLRIDYSYSNTIDYNCFPWPYDYELSSMKRERIESTAQMILDARKKYPRSTLADLYDERTMPPELRKAHSMNDSAVLDAYGFKEGIRELDIVIDLMYRYKEITGCEEVGLHNELIDDPFDY